MLEPYNIPSSIKQIKYKWVFKDKFEIMNRSTAYFDDICIKVTIIGTGTNLNWVALLSLEHYE